MKVIILAGGIRHKTLFILVDMCETEKYRYYHATNEGGYILWYDFCVEFY